MEHNTPADPNALLWQGLYLASPSMVEQALAAGADVNSRYGKVKSNLPVHFDAKDTPLHGAFNPRKSSSGSRVAKTSKLDISGVGAIVDVLMSNGADLSLQDALGYTPLAIMVKSDLIKIPAATENLLIEKAREAGVINHQSNVMQYSALHIAAILGRCRLAIRLCKSGAAVSARMENGKVPLSLAFGGLSSSSMTGKPKESTKFFDTIDGLLNYGADVNQRDDLSNSIGEQYPKTPIAFLEVRKFNFQSTHPITHDTLLDFHVSRLEDDFYGAMSAIRSFCDADLLHVRQFNQTDNLALIERAIGKNQDNEHHLPTLETIHSIYQQVVLKENTLQPMQGKPGPRL